MNKIVLKTSLREKTEKSKHLRTTGQIPASYYVKGDESKDLKVTAKDFKKTYGLVGDSGLLYLEIDQEKRQKPVLVGEVQHDSLSGAVLHVAFRGVDLKDKIKAEIPVEIVGEFGLKDADLVTLKNTIEVEALPTDLPEKFEIDVSKLTEVGQTVTLADLDYDKEKVELVLSDEGTDSVVVMAQEHHEVVEEEPAQVESTEESTEATATTGQQTDETSSAQAD
ncbi:MAG: 50S ribosomal protein L25 [Patescibacteria group bacterium]